MAPRTGRNPKPLASRSRRGQGLMLWLSCAAAASASFLSSGPSAVATSSACWRSLLVLRSRAAQGMCGRARPARMRFDEPEPEPLPELERPRPSGSSDDALSVSDMAELSSRLLQVRENDALQRRLEALPHAWVLVFDHETDDEAVYSMELDEHEKHVVVAFEDDTDAGTYAASMADSIDPSSHASVQALDLEALVVSSREADFRVAIVFKGDLDSPDDVATSPLITGQTVSLDQLRVSFTIVPDEMFSEKSSADFLDPAEDHVWVLIQDPGTGDEQFFSVRLNGTDSVVCFKDEAAADRCCDALRARGGPVPTATAVLLEEVLDAVNELALDDMEVCLVEEVVERLGDDEGPPRLLIDYGDSNSADDDSDPVLHVEQSSVRSLADRQMLDELYSSADNSGTGDEGGDQQSSPPR